MCTLIILRRPGHAWPLLLAANRDEMAGRPWSPPARHWPDRPEVVAGRDELAGGSWLGLNDAGVVAAVLNRQGSLGPAAGKRSRGELVLEALDHADAAEAARALAELDGAAYRPFNLMVADNRDCFWLKAAGGRRIEVHGVAAGLHMLTALDLDDPSSPRIGAYLPRFRAAPAPDPAGGDWRAWQALMAETGDVGGLEAEEEAPAMTFRRADGFGTVSGALMALAAPGAAVPAVWLFAAGPPGRAPYRPA
jgi:hypothetical protein